MFMVFDSLFARGNDLRDRRLRVRRNVLEGEVDGQQIILPARRMAENGLEAWAEVLARRYEGYVGKDEEALYREGRTLAWLKVKVPHYDEGERGREPTRNRSSPLVSPRRW